MKVKQTECSETSAYKIQTTENYPEESIQHSEHGESLKSRRIVYLLVIVQNNKRHTVYVLNKQKNYCKTCGPGSSVGIAIGDGLGFESPVEARFSAPVQTGHGAHPASCTKGTGTFPGVKSGRGVTLTPHPF